jgi:hypothetical protein
MNGHRLVVLVLALLLAAAILSFLAVRGSYACSELERT